jgi:hypothetical protein
MSKKTITKNSSFVIFVIGLCCLFSGCFAVSSSQIENSNRTDKIKSERYGKPEIVGTIKTNEITESSGIAASKCQENVFWTHNDSGDGAFVFALDSKGEKLGTWKVKDAKNIDWEDIAAFKNPNGECFLYIGDIGNNSGARSDLTIYRVREPKFEGANKNSSRKNPISTEPAAAIRFHYPEEVRHDAETLLVHPVTGDVYILSKRLQGASGVYKLPLNYSLGKTNRLVKVADFAVPALPNGFVTGGDISSDGKRVVICDYFAAYEIVLPENAKSFDEIWKQESEIVQLGERAQGEAVCYSADDKAIYATSEKLDSPLIQVKRK